jgi:uncharacterized protein YndB with AHSA1/START domain
MAQIRVAAEREIVAPPAHVYQYIVNYQEHHPRWLPPAFSNFEVESGGTGEGTVIRFNMQAGRRNRVYRMRVAEPVTGSVITESDLDSSLVTTFTVTPRDDASHVRIETAWRGAGGVGGFFERAFAPRVLRRLYADELDRLDRYARERG